MIENLQKELRALKNPEKAKILAVFFKTGKGQYGEGDVFLGLTVPQIRAILKKHSALPLEKIEKIIKSKFHEERLAAVLILVDQFQRGSKEKQKEIFEFYLANTKWINNWDLVDLSASQIVGAYLEKKPKKILFEFAKSEILWERRIAMIATFFEIKMGKSETALLIAQELLADKHDLIHKAAGWMLREVGKRCTQAEEEVFLQKHAIKMPRTMLRYAIERFSEQKRQYYLKLKT